MILQLFKKKQELTFERTYAVPIDAVWKAWTQPELLRGWWGPDKTTIPECGGQQGPPHRRGGTQRQQTTTPKG